MDKPFSQFNQFFKLIPATNADIVTQSQRLRYRVYCVEHHFLDTSHYPDLLEKDDYDGRSVHTVLQHKSTGVVAATVRVILADRENPEHEFPIEKFDVLRREERDKIWRVPRQRLGEISRFAVSKEFRRRIGEAHLSHGISNQSLICRRDASKRLCSHITLGLFKAVVQMSHRHGVTHWYAVMEPGLMRLLERFGIHFLPIGPLVNHHGMRQPCIGRVSEVLSGILEKQPLTWEFITDDGSYSGDGENSGEIPTPNADLID